MNEAVQKAWLAFCHDQNDSTFAAFYDGTKGFIYAICNRVVDDEEDAADILQSVYSQLLKLASLPEQALAVPDIDDVVRRLALRLAETRRKSRQRSSHRFELSEIIETTASREPCARTVIADEQIRQTIRSAITRLEPSMRQVLLMQYEEGMTQQQVADALQVSRPYITRLSQKATETVERQLRMAGITESLILALVFVLAKNELPARVPLTSATVYGRIKAGNLTVAGLGAGSNTIALLSGGALKSPAVIAAIAAAVAIGAFGILETVKQPAQPVERIRQKRESSSIPARVPAIKRHGNTSPAATSVSSFAAKNPVAAAAVPANSGSLSGRIVSRYTGIAIANVRVQAIGTDSGTSVAKPRDAVISDPNGEFVLSGLTPGQYQLRAIPQSPWLAEQTTVSVVAREDNPVGPMQLNRLGAVYCRVLSEAGDEPVAGVEVLVKDPVLKVQARSHTDADGRCTFKDLPLPEYSIYLPEARIARAIHIPEDKDAEITLYKGEAKLSGIIKRAGTPLAKAYVRAYRNEDTGYISHYTWADALGHYELAGIPEGKWILEVQSPEKGYDQTVHTIVDLDAQHLAIFDAEVPSGRLVGMTRDESGSPLPDLILRAQPVDSAGVDMTSTVPSDYVTSSSSTGTFAFGGLPPGQYTISFVTNDGRVGSSGVVQVSQAGEANADVSIHNSGTGALESTALSFASESPLPQAWCTLIGPDGPVAIQQHRDSAGLLKVSGLSPGNYTVCVSANGYSIMSHQVQLAAGETSRFTDVLEDAGVFRWILYDSNGLGKTGVKCQLYAADHGAIDPEKLGETGSDGIWTIRGLRPGKYVAEAVLRGKMASVNVIINAHALTQNRTELPDFATADSRNLTLNRK